MKILIVCYDFRESALAGSYRARKFFKFAKRAGHDVSVLCSNYDGLDVDNNIHIVRSGNLENRNFLNRLYMRLFYYPDPSSKWAGDTIAYIKNNKDYYDNFDVMFVTSPPHAIQKIAVFLKKNYNSIVISDFRDDFLTNHRTRWYTPVHYMMGAFLERDVFKNSDILIANTDIVRLRFISRYPKLEGKIITVTNGYDEDDFTAHAESNKNNSKKVKISYIGDGYKNYISSIIASVCDDLISSDMSESFEFETAGNGFWDVHKNYKNWIHHGQVSQKEANEITLRSDVLLIIMPQGEREPSGTIPLKTFVCLRSGRKIIYYGERGSLTELISKFDGVEYFPRDKISDFYSWLVTNKHYLLDRTYDRSGIESYSFECITNTILGAANEKR